ncbi:MAG: TolC family protein, partial [Candidatus Firestonebacteria bacterium]|nr:TolC family protein [Candidatus Firestonebacteria bacterium]
LIPYLTGLVCLLASLYAQAQTPEAEGATSTAQYIEMNECQRLAEQHYQPLKLAQEEVAVADAKALEAARELWPNLAAKGEYTKGAAVVELGTPGFTEQSYGVQMSYTLFQGGRLWATYKQADDNLKIARLKYEKTRQAMIYEVTEAFWNLARAQANVADYQDAYREVSRYSSMADKLHAAGTLMKKMMLSANSQKRQCEYQIQSCQADLEKFLWKWTEVLGLEEPPLSRPQAEIPFQEKEFSLERSLKLAFEHNPEIQIQKLTLDAGHYELQTKNSYDWPKVELTGFYGRSGGAYESEALSLREDYNFGVKLTQPFAWNSLDLSGFNQKTSPKLGQSSLTESKTTSGTFNILDGFKSAAEKQEAAWHFHQAQFNLDKAKQDVANEVREAYFNYRKALAQVRNSQLDVDLAERELSIQKINLRDDKATLPDVAEARNKVTGARVSMREAYAFYLISLAALEKAVGMPEEFKVGEGVK